jgi:hypothetical protein
MGKTKKVIAGRPTEEQILKKIEDLRKDYAKSITKIRKDFGLPETEQSTVSDVIREQKDIVENNKEQTTKEYIAIALLEAEKIWLNIQVLFLEHFDTYIKMGDDEKIDFIKQDFGEFYNEFPIVSRYMVCMGQYRRKAFHKFLEKCRVALANIPEKRDPDYMQNQWIERQADYVRYLWEEYQTHVNKKQSNAIWLQAYNLLKDEFKQFKSLHKNIEEKVEKDRVKHKTELVKEMAGRIISGQQKLETNETLGLLNSLREKLYKQRYTNMVKQIKADIKYINPSVAGAGRNKDAQVEYEEELKQSEYKKKYKRVGTA